MFASSSLSDFETVSFSEMHYRNRVTLVYPNNLLFHICSSELALSKGKFGFRLSSVKSRNYQFLRWAAVSGKKKNSRPPPHTKAVSSDTKLLYHVVQNLVVPTHCFCETTIADSLLARVLAWRCVPQSWSTDVLKALY